LFIKLHAPKYEKVHATKRSAFLTFVEIKVDEMVVLEIGASSDQTALI